MDLHDDVHRVVRRYLDAVGVAAPGLVEGLHLVGSTVLGDYHPGVSDVDFVAVTAQPLTDGERAVLAGVHRTVAVQRPSFDGPYVTVDELRTSPAEGPFHLGGTFGVGREGRSPVEWTTLARYGVALCGSEPAALGIHLDAAELANWTRANLAGYWSSWLARSGDPATPAATALLTDWGVAWVVLGVSRLHYTLTTGDITSKSGAGRYAVDAFPARWHGIVTEALRCRPCPLTTPRPDTAGRRDETRNFLAFVIGAALGSTP